MSQRIRTVLSLVLFTLMISVGLFGLLRPTQTHAATGINNQINFEGRLFGNTGAIVADGSYSIQFKIYQDGTGTATGDPGGTLLWTENDTVTVVNGYFSVNLGAVTSLSSVNFNSDTIWLSLNVNSDGEMLPMKRLASDAYAFNTLQLQGLSASAFGQLSANNTFTGTNLFQNTVTIQGSAVAFAANASTGAVTIGGSLQATSTNTLALDSSVTGAPITIGAANATSIQLGRTTLGVKIPSSSSLTLGTPNTGSGGATVPLTFANSTNGNLLTLQSGVTTASFSLTLPTADGTSGQCLQTSGGTSGNLGFGSCIGGIAGGVVNISLNNLATIGTTGTTVAINTSLLPGVSGSDDLGSGTNPFRNLYISGSSITPASNNFELSGASTHGTEIDNLPDVSGTSTICVNTAGTYSCPSQTLQAAYNYSSGGTTPTIILDTTRNGLDIQDASTTIGANLLNVRASVGSGLGAVLLGVGNTGATTIQGSVANPSVLQVLNGGSASVLTADTSNNRIGVDVVYSQMTSMSAITHTPSTTGGHLAATTYYYKVTAIDGAGGETAPSAEVSNTTTGTTSQDSLSWTAVTGAAGYRIYRSTTASGGSGNETLYAASTGSSYVDKGGAAASALSAPGTVSHSNSTTGGYLLATTTYYYKVSAIDSTGAETALSSEVSQATGATTTNKITLSWTAVSGSPVAYNIYRATTSGYEQLYDVIGATGSPSYSDVGDGRQPGGAPPSTSTAYVASTNVTNNNLQLAVGSNGGANTGQLYVSGLTSSPVLGNIATGTNPYEIVTSGHYAFVPNINSNNVQIFDISQPASPVLVNTVTTDPGPTTVAISGSYMYVGNFSAGTIQVFNISNISSIPAAVADVTAVNSYPYYMSTAGRYLYYTTLSGATQILDISNPTNPVVAGSTAVAGTYQTYNQVVGNYLYVLGDYNNTIYIYNIQNPYITGITPADTFTNGVTGNSYVDASSFTVVGRYLYLTNLQDNTFQVYDISNPASVTRVASVTTLSGPQNLVISGNTAYISTNTTPGYVQSFDITNPYHPTALGSIAVGGNVYYLALSGRYGYVVNYTSGTLQSFNLGGSYVQSLESGNTELGNLQVDNSESIFGSSSINGGLTVGNNLNVQGGLAVHGPFTPPNYTSATEPSNCSSATINGAIYYNTTTNAIRVCQYNSTANSTRWSDLATTQDLGILAYGVMPDSGNNPGDLASLATPNVSGPCKVSWASTVSVNVAPCTAYSGGRKINVPAVTFTGLSGSSKWYAIYLDPTVTNFVTDGGAAFSETGSANTPTFNAAAPLVQLADVTTGPSNTITGIYDTRVFTTDTKSFADVRTVNDNGWVVKQYTNVGQSNITSSGTDGNLRGVIVSTTGGAVGGTIGAVIVTSGPVFVKATGTIGVGQYVLPSSTTAGYAATSATANSTIYGNLGIAQTGATTLTGGVCGSAGDCQYSVLVDLHIK